MKEGKGQKRKKIIKITLSILVVLIAVRIILPYVILHFVNKKLEHLQGYYGEIQDISMELYRGAYSMDNIFIHKVDTIQHDTTDFFDCDMIDFSLQWKALFHGKVVGEIEFEKPVLKYTLDKTIGKKREKDTVDFIQVIKDLHPLKINRFIANDGELHYVDMKSNPKVDILIDHFLLEGTGLTNKPDTNALLPASITMNGNLYNGEINVRVKLDPLNKVPTFDLKCELLKTELKNFNDFFKAYGNFTVEAGTMSLYSEFATKENKFRGYVKPLIKEMHIKQGEGNFVEIVWEALLGVTAKLLTNPSKGQLGTKVPVEGEFVKTNVGIPEAIGAVLKNAFVQALKPSIDYSISIYNVDEQKKKNFFKRVIEGAKAK